jgi:hypothetical protein
VITLFFFETQEAAKDAADRLRKLGGHAIKLLSECVEKQEVSRQKSSAAALALESEGFLFIRENENWPMVQGVILTPSLAGEEALEYLEESDSPNKDQN